MQKRTGGGVPGEIMRSARLVMEGRGTEADASALRNYFGVTRGSARAIRQATAQANAMMGRLAQFSAFSREAADGNAAGFAGLGSMGFQAINDLTRSPAFQRALEGAAAKLLGNPAIGARINYATRRGAALGSAALGTGALAVEAGGMLAGFARAVSGVPSNKLRDLMSESRLLEADRHSSFKERRLATKRAAAQSIDDMGAPFGGIGAYFAKKRINVDEKSISKLETEIALKKAGLGTQAAEALYAKSRNQAILEQGYMIHLGMGEEAVAKATRQNIESAINNSKNFFQQAIAAAQIQNYKMSEAYLSEAQRALPGSRGLWNGPQIFKQLQAASTADKLWAKSQSMRAGPRTGE
jgi:hypothetical protein